MASFTPIPNAIAAAPVAGQNTVEIARSIPDADDVVLVRTDRVTYRVAWADLVFLYLDERAIVVDRAGDLVARIESGQIVLAVED